MSQLWVLKAVKSQGDTRSTVATDAVFWLRPGTYSVGRASDIPAPEDKSISRSHATITVPTLAELAASHNSDPCVIVQDNSRYGTIVAPPGTPSPSEPLSEFQAEARANFLVQFGHNSPFRLCHMDWAAWLHPSTHLAARTEAEELGLPKVENFDRADTYLIMPETTAHVDGISLAALMRSCPIVAATWLEEWQERNVWRNERPSEGDHAVELFFTDHSGHRHSVDGDTVRQITHQGQLLGKLRLAWWSGGRELRDADSRDALRRAAEMAGGIRQEWSASGEGWEQGTVLVLPAAGSPVPSALRRFSWMTYDHLTGALASGSLHGWIQPPQEPLHAASPSKKAAASSAKKPRARPRSAIAAADAGEATTDDEQGTPAKRARRVGGFILEEKKEKISPAAAAVPAATPTASVLTEVKPEPSVVAPTPSTTLPAPSLSVRRPQDGWMNFSAKKASQAPPQSSTAAKARPPAPAPRKRAAVVKPAASKNKKIGGKGAKSAAAAAAFWEADGDGADSEAAPAVVIDLSTQVYDAKLIAKRTLPDSPSSGGVHMPLPSAAHNFKLFRRKGDPLAQFTGAVKEVVPYDLEPIRNMTTGDAEEFMREERRRKEADAKADKLFNAAIKTKRTKADMDKGEQRLLALMDPAARAQGRLGKPKPAAKPRATKKAKT